MRTVRRRVQAPHWFDIAALMLGLGVGLRSLGLGVEALNSASGRIDGLPPAPAYVRMILRRLDARPRIARHLWRMCFAFFSAASDSCE